MNEELKSAELGPGDVAAAFQILAIARDTTTHAAVDAACRLPVRSAVRSYALARISESVLKEEGAERCLAIIALIGHPFYKEIPLQRVVSFLAGQYQYEQAFSVLQEIQNPSIKTDSIIGIASYQMRSGNYNLSEKTLDLAFQTAQQINPTGEKETVIHSIVTVLGMMQRWDKIETILSMIDDPALRKRERQSINDRFNGALSVDPQVRIRG